jgi:DNA repair protein RecO (recombination protein O)
MIETATGLVIRTRPLTETSLIVHWLTPQHGRLATVAKGARRPKSPFRGKLDLFYLADFSFARSRRSELHTLREVGVRETHAVLRQDLSALRQASYCAALVEQSTETETPLPAVFELFIALLGRLMGGPAQPETVFAFELKLLKELGLQPSSQRNELNAGAQQILRTLTDGEWVLIARLKLSEAQLKALGQFLFGFLTYHLDKVPKGRNLALQRPDQPSFWLPARPTCHAP